MDFKVVDKDRFKVIGISKRFSTETNLVDIPKFWDDFNLSDDKLSITGEYGICISDRHDSMEYLIADDYIEMKGDYVVKEIPGHRWLVFTSVGPIPEVLQKLEGEIFGVWYRNQSEYQICDNYVIEKYDDVSKYPNGTLDDNYICEVWIPVL